MTRQATAIVASMERLRDAFDFTKHGLADAVAEAAATGIFEYMDAQVDPDNNRWIELSEAYLKRKRKIAPGAPIGELYRKMKAPDELKGRLAAARDRLTQTYGTTAGTRQEADWFSAGNDNQPARRFYELNDLALRYVTQVFDDRLDDASR